jgi:NADPH:quinone reductase-like Zn-dependent oxidoreductase
LGVTTVSDDERWSTISAKWPSSSGAVLEIAEQILQTPPDTTYGLNRQGDRVEIQGKRAVVVGGASGMARATATMLRERGASVAILDLATSAGAEVAAELGGSFHPVDVTDFEGAERPAAGRRGAHSPRRDRIPSRTSSGPST